MNEKNIALGKIITLRDNGFAVLSDVICWINDLPLTLEQREVIMDKLNEVDHTLNEITKIAKKL